MDVKNTGKLAGDDVVQLYLSNLGSLYPTPIRSLKGFDRVHLQPGEVKTIWFSVTPDAFSVINDKNERTILSGKFLFSIGGNQPKLIGTAKEKGILKYEITLNQ